MQIGRDTVVVPTGPRPHGGYEIATTILSPVRLLEYPNARLVVAGGYCPLNAVKPREIGQLDSIRVELATET